VPDGKSGGGVTKMNTTIFPEPVLRLPEADIPINGVTAYLSQAENHQIIFMVFAEDTDLPEHAHEGQWGIVLEGEIELVINGINYLYRKGDQYFIPKGVKHSGKIFAGYADITYFDQKDRYGCKTL
jgi:quercetin dioxygenase-like cupin family protein